MRENDLEAPPQPDLEDARRFAQSSFEDLGWEVLRNEPAPAASLPPVETSLVCLHPAVGVALVDLAPVQSADPVGRLRRRLEALDPASASDDDPPIAYLSLTAADVWRLNIVLDTAFALHPPLAVPDGPWMDRVRRALLPDAFMPAPSRPAAIPARSDMVADVRIYRPARRSRLPMVLAAGLVLVAGGAAAVVSLGWHQAPSSPQRLAEAPEPAPRPAEPPVAGPQAGATAAPENVVPLPPPAPPPVRAAEAAPAAAAPPAGPAQIPAPRPAPGRTALETKRIVVHYVPAGQDVAAALLQPVAGLGGDVEFRPVRATPRSATVRFFRYSDQAAAKDLAERLGGNWRVQDLTRYRPQPSAGTLEVWIPSYFRAGSRRG